ncbi:pentatricopeptide repeat-containing protein mitochondrial [Dorcoceras hygrometricum]|uniref:Pentatricopeptide repeat-containing protein mitochondrial n=1 Tax=Dorcoceras hygrometricum TaxID=472368 RepID=A0A2Z7CQ37_9LAMI|nr:pentatricopeptide repeat-containing protein mitochondrial [Dorcoceras hygrometricum]
MLSRVCLCVIALDIEVEVDIRTRQVGEMELVLAKFQRTNPLVFTGSEGGLMSEGSSKDPKDCTWLNTRTGSDHRMCERMEVTQAIDHTWYQSQQNTGMAATHDNIHKTDASHSIEVTAYSLLNITAHAIYTQAHLKAIIISSHPYLGFLSYNYHNKVPNNSNLPPAWPNNTTKLRDSTHGNSNWELRAKPALSYPSSTTNNSKRSIRDDLALTRKHYLNGKANLQKC